MLSQHQPPYKRGPRGLALWPTLERKNFSPKKNLGSRQRTFSHQWSKNQGLAPPSPSGTSPRPEPHSLTFSASFSLLLATPREAPSQSAAGRTPPVSQSAHMSINVTKQTQRRPQGHSRKEREQALWFAACPFTGK